MNEQALERMEALPYYRWLWRDWRANRRVQRMSYVARGLYRELLDEFWAEGSLANDVAKLADICGCPVDVMEQHWPEISPCWVVDGDTLRNEKMDAQRTAKDHERIAKADAGRRGGLACNSRTRAEASEALAQQLQAQPDIAEQSISRAEQEHPAVAPFLEAWNANCGKLSKLRSLTSKRKSKLRSRLSEGLTLDEFTQAVRMAAASPFCCGTNDRGWTLSFDWLVENDTNIVKVLEAKYSDKQSAAAPAQPAESALDRLRRNQGIALVGGSAA